MVSDKVKKERKKEREKARKKYSNKFLLFIFDVSKFCFVLYWTNPALSVIMILLFPRILHLAATRDAECQESVNVIPLFTQCDVLRDRMMFCLKTIYFYFTRLALITLRNNKIFEQEISLNELQLSFVCFWWYTEVSRFVDKL